MASRAKVQANARYDRKTYERIAILTKKSDNKRAEWRDEANRRGMSLSGFLYACVEYIINNNIDLG